MQNNIRSKGMKRSLSWISQAIAITARSAQHIRCRLRLTKGQLRAARPASFKDHGSPNGLRARLLATHIGVPACGNLGIQAEAQVRPAAKVARPQKTYGHALCMYPSMCSRMSECYTKSCPHESEAQSTNSALNIKLLHGIDLIIQTTSNTFNNSSLRKITNQTSYNSNEYKITHAQLKNKIGPS